MVIQFDCPTCHAKLKAKQEFAGREGNCGKCKSRIVVPEKDDFVIDVDESEGPVYTQGPPRQPMGGGGYAQQQPPHFANSGNGFDSHFAAGADQHPGMARHNGHYLGGLLLTFFLISILAELVFGLGAAAGSPELAALGLLGLLPAIVLHMVLIYQWWAVIQQGRPRTTQGKAVGLMFVPFFNLYWYYQATVGLGEDMNHFCDATQTSGPRVNIGLGKPFYWLSMSMLLPIVGLITSIPAMVCMSMYYRQLSRQAAVFLASGYGGAAPPPHQRGLAEHSTRCAVRTAVRVPSAW